MNDRFLVKKMYICPFIKWESGGILPNKIDYPARWCVIDTEQKIVIDIKDELKYDYMETVSMIYFLEESLEKIKENKRAAIHPTNFAYDKEMLLKAGPIIEHLKNGYEFVDGNDFYNNEAYLEHIKQEDEKEIEKTSKLVEKKQKTKKKSFWKK